MDQMLKSLRKNNDFEFGDCVEEISAIIYIANLSEDSLVPSDIDTATEMVFLAFQHLYMNNYDKLANVLKDTDMNNPITIDKYEIFVSSKWLFQVILLNSIKHAKELLVSDKKEHSCNLSFLQIIIQYILKYVDVLKPTSIHLLRTLQLILSKRSDILTSLLSFEVLKCMNKVALSPITGFKQYARSTSKIAISFLSTEQKQYLCQIETIPARSIDTIDMLKLFSQTYIRLNIEKIIKKVLRMFLNNTESKDAGFLYESTLFLSLDEWKTNIWPLFLQHLRQIEHEGEFFQSLVKYWIPFTMARYKSEFYTFLKDEPIDFRLKAHILLEARKKGFAVISDDVRLYFYNIRTKSLGLKIASTYRKKSICPESVEIKIVIDFLYSNLNTFLEEDDVRSICLFCSQIFLYAHSDLRKSTEHAAFYTDFVNQLYDYCYGSLNTDFFEVAIQVLDVLWSVATGSYKNLCLLYKLEKREFYDEGQNLLYKELRAKNLWRFKSEPIVSKLKNCFIKNEGYSTLLTNLIQKYYVDENFVDITIMKNIVANIENSPTLQNTEKIINCANILLKNNICEETEEFVEEIANLYSKNLALLQTDVAIESALFKNTLYLEIILTASKHSIAIKEINVLLEQSLLVIDSVLENNFSNVSYRFRKVLEAFINNILYSYTQNLDKIWPVINKERIVTHLINIIQKSNMKKPVSLSAEVLKHFGVRMEENEEDRILKILLLDSTLKKIYDIPLQQDLKIRRNPESRLVIHALCVSEKNSTKPLLNWVFNFLLRLTSDPSASDLAVSSALHCLEILVSDNVLQNQTLPFVFKIIVQCVELFGKPNWIVRNANLQLAKALIERFYGVSINSCDRPKNIEDLFVLFPGLSTYFFEILASEELDERAIVVFQFFSESQIKERAIWNDTAKYLDYFQVIFVYIIKRYQNHYGKLAVRSYVSLCNIKCIPRVVCEITEYIKSNYRCMKKNIFANFVLLLQELYEKYSSVHIDGLKEINFYMKDLLSFLRRFDSRLFDFLLLKVMPLNDINRLTVLNCENSVENRLFLHNNLPFVVINAKPCQICDNLDTILSKNVPNFMQVKVLSILVQRFQNNEFESKHLQNVLKILFEKSLSTDINDKYLLLCYFNVISLFIKNVSQLEVSDNIVLKSSNDLYKTMIYVLYMSATKGQIKKCFELCRLTESLYIASISINEEIDNDIMSTLIHFREFAPKQFHATVFKLVLYYALFHSTHLEAYNFISLLTNKTFCSVLAALKAFCSAECLREFVCCENIVSFLHEINNFVDKLYVGSQQSDSFYTIEGDCLIPKQFLKNILKCTGVKKK